MKYLFLILFCITAKAQSIAITNPSSGQAITANSTLNLGVNLTGSVTSVTYWYDNWHWINEITTPPFNYNWTVSLPIGAHTIKARATFSNNTTIDAAEISFNVITEPPSTNIMKLGTNFWFLTNWSGETPFKTGINWSTAYTSNTDIWNPTFIEELAPYGTLRFMDWGVTNNSNVVQWADRRLPSDPNNANIDPFDNSNPSVLPGLAYEWMIDLCNRYQKDLWICLPHQSNLNYWQELATLINQKLNSNRKIYVEYSNETWNGSFGGQHNWCNNQGIANNLPGENQWYKGGAYTMWQSLKIFNTFQNIFGTQAMGTRVIRVFASGGNLDIPLQAFTNVMNSTSWNQGQKVDMFAIAPYVGHSLDGANGSIQTLFHNDIDQVFSNQIAQAVAIANANNVELGTYEGGQHITTNAQTWSENPQIYNEYIYMLNKWKPKFKIFMHYAHCGTWGNGGAWGAKSFTGQALSQAHKYRALVDWVAANQPCNLALTMSGTYNDQHTFMASNSILAPPASQTNILGSTSNIIYQAGNSILLNPGFEAQTGAIFKAIINGCN